MNASLNPDDYFESIAAGLDQYAHVPNEVLWDLVTRAGACVDVCAENTFLEFLGGIHNDRDMAARICAGCPVQNECLELELRTAGKDGLGVWGALSEADRRTLYPVWLARRRRAGRDESNGGGR